MSVFWLHCVGLQLRESLEAFHSPAIFHVVMSLLRDSDRIESCEGQRGITFPCLRNKDSELMGTMSGSHP